MTTEQSVQQAGRPAMPAGYGLTDPQSEAELLPWSWLETRLAEARNYWIGTTRPDGRPHVMPVWGIWLEGTFIFSTDRAARKAKNVAHNPAMTVHLESGDEVVILEGLAEEVTEAGLLARYAAAYKVKYDIDFNPDDPAAAGNVTYGLRPQRAFAWLEQDFPHTATRWQ